MTADTLISKLQCFVRLSADEKAALQTLVRGSVTTVQPRHDLARQGETPGRVKLVVDGWVCRYVDLEDGRRQIVAFLLPGDLCDLGIGYLKHMDHSITTISSVTMAEFEFDALEELRQKHRRLDLALQWNALVEAAIARQWVLNLGQRSATERLAHLFIELLLRLRAIGHAPGNSYDFPVTQQHLGEAAGLSTVHINRSLMQLRGENLIVLKGKNLLINDLQRLKDLAMFDPVYLHLGRVGRTLDAPAD